MTKRFGRARDGRKGWEEREVRRQARAAADPVKAKEWDEEAEKEERA
jgi:hypothetical protein